MTDTAPHANQEQLRDRVECAIGLNVNCGGTAGVHKVRDAVLAVVQPELDRLRQHVEELQEKLLTFDDNGKCCCSFEGPGDVCLVHSPTVARLRVELAAADKHISPRHWHAFAEHAAPEAIALHLDSARIQLRRHEQYIAKLEALQAARTAAGPTT